MRPQTSMDEHVIDVRLPLQQAEPTPRCDVCEALVHQRAEARDAGDFSKASDCNVEIRRHPHPPRRARP